MPFSIGLYFDPATETMVREIWASLDKDDLAHYYLQSGNRPHITLAIFDDAHLPQAEGKIAKINRQTRRFSLSFQQVGIFHGNESAVFWGPTVTRELLDFHARIHDQFKAISKPDQSGYYLPGRWVPHCGLAMEITEDSKIPKILETCLQLPGHHTAEGIEIGLIAFKPVRSLFCYPLG